GDKDAMRMVQILERIVATLGEGRPIRALALEQSEQEAIRQYCFITAKPVMYVANVNEDGFKDNPYLTRVQEYAEQENAPVVAICASVEAEISQLDDEDKEIFLQDMGMDEPGLNRVIRAAYELIGLQTYFTAGVNEVRAWSVPVGSNSPHAVVVIHTDFERDFSLSQTIAYEDFMHHGGEQGVREAGKMLAQCKHYSVQDGDLLN